MRRLGIVAATATLFLLVAAPALAQYPNPTVSVRVAAGVISGSNWCPNSDVSILFDGDQIGTAAVGSDGTFSTDFSAPAGASAGEHTVTVEGLEGDCSTPRSVDQTIVLGEEGVAFTGVDGSRITLGVAIAIGLLVAGGLLLFAARRRRAAQGA